MSIYHDAGQAVSEIELLNAAIPDAVVPPGLSAPAKDYGNLAWNPFTLPDGDTGYTAPKGDGTYYYFGPGGTLYHDGYSGEVHPQDVANNAIGSVSTFDFAAADGAGGSTTQSVGTSSGGVSYGGVYYG